MTHNSSNLSIIISDAKLGKMDNALNVLKDICSIITEYVVKLINIVSNIIEM
jgi:hypothetical protein